MKTPEEREKIRSVVLYLLNKFPEGLHRVSFYKLLFFAQQYELVHTGKTLLPDKFLALTKGPVPSFVQGLILAKENGNTPEELTGVMQGIDIACSGDLYATDKPDMGYLANIDVQAIDATYSMYGGMTADELIELSHREQCWKNAMAHAKTDPEKNVITRIDIAKSGGATKAMLDYIKGIEVRNRLLPI